MLFSSTVINYGNATGVVVFTGTNTAIGRVQQQVKEAAEEEQKKAEAEGDMERAKQMAGRSIKVTDAMMADAKKLVKLMGVPVVEAPCEAEA